MSPESKAPLGPADDMPEPLLVSPETLSWIEQFTLGMSAIKMPLISGIISLLVLSYPDQVQEVYRVLSQERLSDKAPHQHWILALVSVVLLSLVLWQIGRQLAHIGRDGKLETIEHTGIRGAVDAWGPRIIATLPLIGAAIGIWLSRSYAQAVDQVPARLLPIQQSLAQLDRDGLLGAGMCLLLAVLILLGTAFIENRLLPVYSRRSRRISLINTWMLFPLVILGSAGFFVYHPVELPQYFGSIPIFTMWMVSFTIMLALFGRYYSVAGVPILTILLIVVALIELMGLADNHKFRNQTATIDRPKIEAAYRTWIASRADAAAYQAAGKPYPIYIVAAEGGGLYAAYQTAKFLTRMQDLCPNFAQHVFTISSVSGGSLGAAIFAGLTKSEAVANSPAKPCLSTLPAAGPLEQKVNDILSKDLLSPLVWGGLFPDFIQRFVPWPFQALDRARYLEAAFEQAWRQASSKAPDLFQNSMFDLCGKDLSACSRGATPILALNVTNVETGMQVVLSPVDFSGVGAPWSNSPRIFDFFMFGIDPVAIPLSTAVGLSARFPWITPTGWYDFADQNESAALGKPSKRRMTFADGAYVDNSGVSTGSRLTLYLQDLFAKDPSLPKAEVKLIMITATWLPLERFWMDAPKDQGTGDFISPLAAAYASWQSRGYLQQSDASTDFRSTNTARASVAEAAFYYNYMPLPLGWQLSNLARQYIDLFRGDPQTCDDKQLLRTMKDHAVMADTYINRTNCVFAGMLRDLTPAAPAAAYKPITTAE